MADFPFHIISWWQWIIMTCQYLATLAAFVYLLKINEPYDYIVVQYFVALVLGVLYVGWVLYQLNQTHPEIQQYLKEEQIRGKMKEM